MYPRLAISAPRSSERPKLGHDLRRVPRDRIERETHHSDHDTPNIEGRLNVDFHTGTTPRRSTKNGDASRRTLGVILERKTGDRRRLERWN